jgi:hypothetical protein
MNWYVARRLSHVSMATMSNIEKSTILLLFARSQFSSKFRIRETETSPRTRQRGEICRRDAVKEELRYVLHSVGRPLWREDRSVFCMRRWPLPAQSFLGRSPLGLATVFYCFRFETSLFVASYDSQGHGGGIRPRLHTGLVLTATWSNTTT